MGSGQQKPSKGLGKDRGLVWLCLEVASAFCSGVNSLGDLEVCWFVMCSQTESNLEAQGQSGTSGV